MCRCDDRNAAECISIHDIVVLYITQVGAQTKDHYEMYTHHLKLNLWRYVLLTYMTTFSFMIIVK